MALTHARPLHEAAWSSLRIHMCSLPRTHVARMRPPRGSAPSPLSTKLPCSDLGQCCNSRVSDGQRFRVFKRCLHFPFVRIDPEDSNCRLWKVWLEGENLWVGHRPQN